jgi:hypothetical protein
VAKIRAGATRSRGSDQWGWGTTAVAIEPCRDVGEGDRLLKERSDEGLAYTLRLATAKSAATRHLRGTKAEQPGQGDCKQGHNNGRGWGSKSKKRKVTP